MQAKNAKKQNFFINLLSKTEEQKETKNAKAQNDSRGYAKNAQHFRISLVSHSVSAQSCTLRTAYTVLLEATEATQQGADIVLLHTMSYATLHVCFILNAFYFRVQVFCKFRNFVYTVMQLYFVC